MFHFDLWYAHINIMLATLSAVLCWLLLTLGQRIRLGRLVRGLSQERLAELLGVNPRTVQRWEQDQMYPRAYHMKQLENLGFFDLAYLEFETVQRIIQQEGTTSLRAQSFCHDLLEGWLDG